MESVYCCISTSVSRRSSALFPAAREPQVSTGGEGRGGRGGGIVLEVKGEGDCPGGERSCGVAVIIYEQNFI